VLGGCGPPLMLSVCTRSSQKAIAENDDGFCFVGGNQQLEGRATAC
jgi:hypothetical protein